MKEEVAYSEEHSPSSKFIYYPLYLISFILFIIVGLIQLIESQSELLSNYNVLFSIILIKKEDSALKPYFNPDERVLYAIFALLLFFPFLIVFLMLLKDKEFNRFKLFKICFSDYGKLIPIGTFLQTAEFIVPLALSSNNDYERYTEKNKKILYGLELALSAITLAFFIFVYIKMDKCGGDKPSFLLKKCYLSTSMSCQLVSLLNACIVLAALCTDSEKSSFRFASWFCMLIFAIITMVGMWFWNDIVLGIIGFLFELGFVIYSIGLPTDEDYFDKYYRFNVPTSSMMMFIILVFGVVIICMKKDECLN